MKKSKSKNYQTLKDFKDYCKEHPEQRFWQALRNWSGKGAILAVNKEDWDYEKIMTKVLRDTFYWEL